MGEVVEEWSIGELGLLVEKIVCSLKHSQTYKVTVYNPLGLTQSVHKKVPLQQILHIVRPTLKIIDQKLLLIENVSIHSLHIQLSYKLIILNVAVYEGRVLALGYLVEDQTVSHEKLLVF